MQFGNSQNPLFVKRQRFKKQLRTSFLNKYMSKIRQDMNDKQQIESLLNLIHRLSCSAKTNQIKASDLNRLIDFANANQTYAIVYLAILLSNKSINIQMLLNNNVEQNKDSYINDKILLQCEQKNIKIKRIKFQNSTNQGWIMLIRNCVSLGFCTQQMLIHCLKTIIKSKSQISIHFSLESIYILIKQKKVFKIKYIIRLIQSYDEQFQTINKYLLLEQFFYCLMKYSSNQYVFADNDKIKQISNKILMLCLQDQQITQQIFLKIIPLPKLSIYFKQKLLDNENYYKIITIKMLSNILISLSKSKQLINMNLIFSYIFKGPVEQIMKIFLKQTTEILQQKRIQKGYHNLTNINNFSQSYFKNQFQYVSQRIYLIEVLIDQYMSLNTQVNLFLYIFQILRIQEILINLYNFYYKPQYRNYSKKIDQIQNQYQLTEQQISQMILTKHIQKIVQKIINEFLIFKKLLAENLHKMNKEQQFQILKLIILSRIRNSNLKVVLLNFQQLRNTIQIQI